MRTCVQDTMNGCCHMKYYRISIKSKNNNQTLLTIKKDESNLSLAILFLAK